MMGGRRPRLAAVVVALAAVGVAAVLGTTGRPDPDDPSSRSAGPGGTLALYAWLHDGLGIEGVRRLSGSFDLRGLDLLVLHRPTTPLTAADVEAVARFLSGGGVLLLDVDAASVAPAAALLDRLGVVSSGRLVHPAVAHAAQPLDPAGTLGPIPVGPGSVSFADVPDLTPLLVAGGRTVMVGRPLGAGRAYVLGDAYALSNAGIRPERGDAAALVLALLERSRGGGIGVDEVHHGETGASGVAAILAGPLGASAGLGATILLLALALSGRRLGPPIESRSSGGVPSLGDYVAALAALYQRTGHRGAVAARFADELRSRVAAATGVDPRLNDTAFVAALEPFGAARAAAVAAVLARARTLAASEPGDADILALAQRVDAVEREWLAGPR